MCSRGCWPTARPLYGAIAEGYWEDVGTLEAYLSAHKDVLDQRVLLDIPGFRISDGVWLGEGAEVSPDAQVLGPAVIGAGCKIEAGCRLGEYVVLGSNVRVLAGADLERTVVHDNAYIGAGARVRGTVIGRASNLRANVRCEEGVVLGDEVFVGENAVLGNDVKVYPFKTIEDGAIVNSSIIWESRGARSLFGRMGVTGLSNVDITPELAAKVAMAYGTSLRKGTTVVTSRDSSRSARMLKRAMMAGLNSAGVNVFDLEVASLPVTRFLVRSPRVFGGLSVRLRLDDPESVVVRFFDSMGADISEDAKRKIERLFQREDYRRVLPEEIGDIDFPPRALEDYTAALESTIDIPAIVARKFKLVVDHGYGATSFVMPNVLAKLGADVPVRQPVRLDRRHASNFDRDGACERVAGLVVASGAHLGAVLRPRRRAPVPGRRRGRRAQRPRVAAGLRRSSCAATCSATASPCPSPPPPTPPAWPPPTASTSARRRCRRAALADAATEPGVGFAADGEGGFILPGFLPAFDAAAAFVKMLDLLARDGRQLSDRARGAAARAPGPRDGRDAVGPEGARDAVTGRARRLASWCSSTA